jgi:HK97 family phage portal protein
MKWFGRKSAPAARFGVPWLQADGEVGGFARGYEAQVDEVYRRNPVGLRAVRLVAEAVGGLTVDGDERGLVKPALLERAAAGLLLHGNAYVQLVADGHDRPAELFALRPERVSVAAGADGWPAAYVYRAGASVTRIARTDALGRVQVAHVRSLHPGDDHYGLGCLDAAIGAASVHNRASRWNKALLDNAARPSGALTYENGDGALLSAEQFDRLKGELAEQYAGSANAGRPLLLDGGLKWQAMSLTPADMDFVALKEGAARDIALAFGVPPVLLGLPGDATYANMQEAGRALYRQTVLPLAGKILAGLSEMLSDWLGPVRLAVDVDAISELAEDRARLWERLSAADFQEKSSRLGLAERGRGSGRSIRRTLQVYH